ncbi:GtrA family protein [Sphingomonas sp. LY29]|uniref:GtrA family protein n=1 Tax=Sphingomonas sp. LY29 TaxID=3095341 RepID=UPI002D79917A|nr:GtrA family protein [Sphingomonas sp. LY29]WRP24810.1 GtrA family protein [Sphingomonas sp. LY29]
MISSALQSIDPDRRAVLVQMIRYALAGFAITVLVAASYWAITEFFGLDPMISFTIVFLFFSAVSYVTHGLFSFQGHGTRDRHHVRLGRFLLVNVLGYLVNQGFIWLLVKQLDGPTWWPTLPMLFVTPLLTFALHRRFVYS